MEIRALASRLRTATESLSDAEQSANKEALDKVVRAAASSCHDVERWLKTHGWRENDELTRRWTGGQRDKTYGYLKQYGGVWLVALVSHSFWDKDLRLFVSPTSSLRIPGVRDRLRSKIDELGGGEPAGPRPDLSRIIRVPYDQVDTKLEPEAKALAAEVKAVMEPPKRREHTGFQWREHWDGPEGLHEGPEGRKRWLAAIETAILSILTAAAKYGTSYRDKSVTTRGLTLDLLENRGLATERRRSEDARDIVATLERMARARKIEKMAAKDIGGGHTYWIIAGGGQ
jgi:hypothetical protein